MNAQCKIFYFCVKKSKKEFRGLEEKDCKISWLEELLQVWVCFFPLVCLIKSYRFERSSKINAQDGLTMGNVRELILDCLLNLKCCYNQIDSCTVHQDF